MNPLESKYVDRSKAPLRYQTVYGKPVEILDLSDLVHESASPSAPDIDVISTSKLFREGEVVIGVGRPNVFLLIPDGKGNHVRFAAKSCWRGEAKVERTMGVVQSGVFLILKDLTDDQISRIRASAKNHEGERGATCVNANARVLSDAGIVLWNGEKLDGIYLPVSAFRAIEKYGLQVDGILLNIEKAKTTKRYLEHQMLQTNKAVLLTLARHIKRFFSGILPKKSARKREDKGVRDVLETPNPRISTSGMGDLDLRISKPSKLALPLRLLWGAHTIFTLEQDRVDIDDYLTEPLKAYPHENPSVATRVKKNVLFNRHVVGGINKLLQKGTASFPQKSESDIHAMFEVHGTGRENKYNIVASTVWLMMEKIRVGGKLADWILSKHVLISNYHEGVRFAGETWKDENGVIWVNRNSGTYCPKAEQLDAFVEFLRAVFPNVDIRADYET